MIGELIKYTIETLENARNFASSLEGTSVNPDVDRYLTGYRTYPSSAMGTMGMMFCDIATNGVIEQTARKNIGKTSSRIILLTDITDDIIDKGQASLEEKFRFLDGVNSNLFGTGIYSIHNVKEEAAYSLARRLFTDFMSRDTHGVYNGIFDSLVGVIKLQFTAEDPDVLIEIARKIGACCADAAAVVTELETDSTYPVMRNAARKMGEYCEFLDNWYELKNDLQEGVNTFPTVVIRKEGNRPSVRNHVKTVCLSEAERAFESGYHGLDRNGKEIYRAMKLMIDCKYRIM